MTESLKEQALSELVELRKWEREVEAGLRLIGSYANSMKNSSMAKIISAEAFRLLFLKRRQ